MVAREIWSAELSEIVTGLAGASTGGKRGRAASGAGCHPSRRRIFRIIISLSPSRPAIPRLLMPWALRRRIVRSRGLGLGSEPSAGRPSGRTKALSPRECRRSWKRRRVRVE